MRFLQKEKGIIERNLTVNEILNGYVAQSE